MLSSISSLAAPTSSPSSPTNSFHGPSSSSRTHRVAPTSPQHLHSTSMSQTVPLLECDYDVNPTYLYQAIEARQWGPARQVLKGNSHKSNGTLNSSAAQVATWVVRKETNGKLRWRLLPLHAAIIFQSPLEIIELLLHHYPSAAQCKDDQGMLPLHLAFRNDTDWDVVEELLTAYPQAIAVKDRKGRTPLQCATGAPGRKKANVLELYTQIAISTERQRFMTESQSALQMRVSSLQTTHAQTLQKVKREWEDQVGTLQETVLSLEAQLKEKTQLLEATSRKLGEKHASELELTSKLSQVSRTLDTVNHQQNQAQRRLEERYATQARQLQETNQELLGMISHLMTQQNDLLIQFDKQTWEAKDQLEQRQAVWKQMMDLQLLHYTENKRDRDSWRNRVNKDLNRTRDSLEALAMNVRAQQGEDLSSVMPSVPQEIVTTTQIMKPAEAPSTTPTSYSRTSKTSNGGGGSGAESNYSAGVASAASSGTTTLAAATVASSTKQPSKSKSIAHIEKEDISVTDSAALRLALLSKSDDDDSIATRSRTMTNDSASAML